MNHNRFAILVVAALLAVLYYPANAHAQNGARTSVASCPANMLGTCSDLEVMRDMIIRLTDRATPRSLRMALNICQDVRAEAQSFRSSMGEERTVNGGNNGGAFLAPEAVATPQFVLSLEAFCSDLNTLVVEGRPPTAPTYSMTMANSAIERISAGAAMEAAVTAEEERHRTPVPSPSRGSRRAHPYASPGMCREPPSNGPPAPSPPG